MQAWFNRFFRKRDLLILIVGLAIMQGLVCLLINRFMFHPVKGGYDKTLDGYVDIGTNGVSIAARVIGVPKKKKVIMYCHGNAEDMTSIDGRFSDLVGKGYAITPDMDFLTDRPAKQGVTGTRIGFTIGC